MRTFEEVYDLMSEYNISTELEMRLVCHIAGCTIETLNDIIYVRTGYRDIDQFLDAEVKPHEEKEN